MKRFQFSLAGVLRQKQWLEEQAKKTLAGELRILKGMEAELQVLEAQYRSLWEAGSQDFGGDMDCRGLEQRTDFARHLQGMVALHLEKMGEQEKAVLSCTESLAQAMKEKKVLDKLRERKLEEYHRYKIRYEGKILDEASMNFFIRQARAGGESSAHS